MISKTEEPLLSPDLISELSRCEDVGLLRDTLSRRTEFVSPAAVEQLAEAVRQQVRVDVEVALRLAEAALAIAQRLPNPESLGLGFRAKANALWFKGNCKGAAELFEIAIAHFEQAGRADEVARTLSSSIQSLALLGEYEQALRAADRARDIFRRLGDFRRLARVDLNAANIHHRQDRFAEALLGYQRAYEQLLPYKDMEGVVGALHNMAVCFIMLNDFNRAQESYGKARALAEQNSMPLLVAQADYNVAYLYFLRGDYQKAIQDLNKTRQLCHLNGDPYHEALCDLDESEIYLELNLTDEAERLSQEAMRRFEGLRMAHEFGRSVVNLAIATHRRHDTDRSIALFAKASTIFARENNLAWQALIDLYRAIVLLDQGDVEQARNLCLEALKYFEASRLDRRAILCYLLLARFSFEAGNLEEARQTCVAAISKLAAIEAPLLSCDANLLLGHIQRNAGEWASAYESYSKARLELETLRGHLQGEELKIAFLKNRIEVYENLVQLCLRENSGAAKEEAFGYVERAKSRTLVELLSKTDSAANDVPDERMRSLRTELSWYYHRIEIEQTRPEGISLERINRLRAEAASKETEFLRAIRKLSPRNEADSVFPADAIPLAEIRAALPAEATLLEYFQIGSQFVVCVVTPDDLNIVPLPSSAQIMSRVRMLDFQLSKFRLKSSYTKTFQLDLRAAIENRLRELYQDLVAPIAPLLRGSHLVVVPHGVLHYLPFHAFLDGDLFLIDRFTVSFAPSASIYGMCHRRKAAAGDRSLLLGVHDKNLPWIKREIRSVAAVVPDARVFLGQQATARVLREVGPISRMIHIATHGFFRPDNPAFSSVRLADSHLSLYDLYSLNLPVDLLTLSGCSTGLNGIATGDELLGLTRGLLCCGAQSLLLTLWDVNDHSTAEFMQSFYGHLQQENKASALRAAMLEVRQYHPHPYYWAPFILIGKTYT